MPAVGGATQPLPDPGRPGRQSELAPVWAERFRGQMARARALSATLTADRLHWRPPEGGWSVGDVFEHLVITAEAYLPAIRDLAASGAAAVDPVNVWWRGTLGGRFLVHAMRSPRKLPAPAAFQVPPAPRAQVVEALVDRHDELVRLLDQARDRHWRKCKLRSPVSSLLRLNLGDAFAIQLAHTDRHLRQAERVLHHRAFGLPA